MLTRPRGDTGEADQSPSLGVEDRRGCRARLYWVLERLPEEAGLEGGAGPGGRASRQREGAAWGILHLGSGRCDYEMPSLWVSLQHVG